MKNIPINRNDIDALLEGLAILGTGGGGNPAWGKMILENDLAHGRTWNLVPLESVPDEWTVVCGGIMGSVKALENIGFGRVLENWESDFPLLRVTRYMEQLLGRRIDAMIPFEAGGLNAPIVLTLAARMGIAAIDADALGRSAPETQMTSWHGHGIQITPMPLADSEGNLVVVTQAVHPTYVDEVGRWVVTKGGFMGANNHHPMTGAQAKATSIPGTFTRALDLSRAIQKNRTGGGNPVQSAAGVLGARRLIEGRIESLVEEERLGFYFTTATIQGTGVDEGRTAQLVIKNEAMLCTLEGQPVTIFPDPIYLLDPETARGYMSVELKPNMRIVLLGAPTHPNLQSAAMTEAGREAFSPTRYGRSDLTYRPMARLTGD